MRAAPTLIILSLMVVAGCTTSLKTPSVGNSPVKDTSFVPPPKSLTERAMPEKKLTLAESVARRQVETGAKPAQ